MLMPETTENEYLADIALMIEALTEYAGPKIETPRDRRAWELIDELAAETGLPPAEVVQYMPTY